MSDDIDRLRAEIEDLRARAWIAGALGVSAPPEVAHLVDYPHPLGAGPPGEVWWTQPGPVLSTRRNRLHVTLDRSICCRSDGMIIYGKAPTWRELMQIPEVRAAMGVPNE